MQKIITFVLRPPTGLCIFLNPNRGLLTQTIAVKNPQFYNRYHLLYGCMSVAIVATEHMHIFTPRQIIYTT